MAEKGSITIDNELDGKKSISHVTVLSFDESANRTLLAVNIETGRKHQIRKHLSGLGFPVVGDRLYGSVTNPTPKSDNDTDRHDNKALEDLQLSAVRLSFICPVSQEEKTFEL